LFFIKNKNKIKERSTIYWFQKEKKTKEKKREKSGRKGRGKIF
jgi:hypothetical protein